MTYMCLHAEDESCISFRSRDMFFSFFWCRLPTEEQKKSFLNSSIYTLLACKRGTLKYEKYRSYSRFPLTDIRFFVFLKSSSIGRKKIRFWTRLFILYLHAKGAPLNVKSAEVIHVFWKLNTFFMNKFLFTCSRNSKILPTELFKTLNSKV